MKKFINLDFGGYANHRVHDMVRNAIVKLCKTNNNAHMTLCVTLNAARALAWQNEFQVCTFQILRHNFPNLMVVLSSCEFDDSNTATVTLRDAGP